MRQFNVSIMGDSFSGKKTFLKQIIEKKNEEQQEELLQPYFPVKIENINDFTFNFFLTSSQMKKLSQTINKVIMSDIIVIFFNLFEEENVYFQDQEDNNQVIQNQMNKYKSIIEPVCEMIFHLNLENKLLFVLNKIDHPFVEYSEDIYNKAEKQIKNILRSFCLNIRIPIVRISSLQNENIFRPFNEEKSFFFEELLKIANRLNKQKDQKIFNFLPIRISVLKVHQIMGVGIVVQGQVLSGTLSIGDDLIILPSYKVTRVKSLQIYNKPAKEAIKSQIVGINLENISKNDIKKGYVLSNSGFQSYGQNSYNEAVIRISLINTFNGIYPGFQLNLIGFNIQLPVYVKEIFNKVDFRSNQIIEDEDEEDNIADIGSFSFMKVVFMKNCYLETFEDFEQLGKFVVIESNVILGFANIIRLEKSDLENEQQIINFLIINEKNI